MTKLIEIGQIVAPHGIKGEVKVLTFLTDPRALMTYAPIVNQDGQVMTMHLKTTKGQTALIALDGVTDRNAAESLRGTRLFADKAKFPPLKAHEYYCGELVGMTAFNADKTELGKVVSVNNYGAGDILEIKGKQTYLVILTQQIVPSIDVDKRQMTVILPDQTKGDEV